jgi:HlyD family secretion protein
VRWIATIGVLAAAGGAAWYVMRRDPVRASVPTFAVVETSFVRRVTAEGNLRAVKATPVTAPQGWRGGRKKIAWLAPDGSQVAEGDVVVKFDATEFEKTLRDGRTDLDTASARLAQERIKAGSSLEGRKISAELSEQELEQQQRFQSKDEQIYSRHQIIESEVDQTLAGAKRDHAVSATEVERRVTSSQSAVLGVQRKKAELAISHAKAQLAELEIRAPHAGLLVLTRNWKGEPPKIGDQLWPGQEVAEIPLLDAMEAAVFVLEVDGSGLREGQPAELRIESRPEASYSGKIRLVDKLAKPRRDGSPVQYFEVTVALDRTEPEVMKPGQRVRAVLVLDEENALVVPRQAVFAKDDKSFVYRKAAHGFETVDVELGAATAGRVVVKSGLAAGDVIALRDPTRSVDQALGSGSDAAGAAGDKAAP